MLPRLLLIFSPSMRTMATCDQIAAKGRMPSGCLALHDLALVVRKDEVDTAAVQPNLRPEVLAKQSAERSMCQPGRPRSPGLSQHGSSGWPDQPFHMSEIERVVLARIVEVGVVLLAGDLEHLARGRGCESSP